MTTAHRANPIPNILTGIRLFAGVVMFAMMAGAAPGALDAWLSPDTQLQFGVWAFWIFVIAASTDWVDGFLARRWNATTRWGAILDPIADKVLITGAILGVLASGSLPGIALPCGLILFREFAVSALRETTAGSVKLPVTLLAKWKTTLQLTALSAELLVASWGAFSLPTDPAIQVPATYIAHTLMWVATVVTLITGAQYWEQTRKALQAQGV